MYTILQQKLLVVTSLWIYIMSQMENSLDETNNWTSFIGRPVNCSCVYIIVQYLTIFIKLGQ